MALFCTILITPSASVTVTTMGSPSGMAATARLVEVEVDGVRPVKPSSQIALTSSGVQWKTVLLLDW